MTMRDIAVALAAEADRVCANILPNGKLVGSEWQVGDLTGAAGHSLKIQLTGEKAGFWYDHATSHGGDMIDLIAEVRMESKGLAAKWAKDFLGIKDDRNGHDSIFDPLKFRWKDKKTDQWRTGDAAWAYHNESGEVIGYVVRFNYPDGRKDVLPIRIIDGKPTWKGWVKSDGKPLFNLHKLTDEPAKPVLVVEGEKTALAAAKLFPEFVVTTCQGGSPSFPHAKWDPLNNRGTVVLWPDADQPGIKAMSYLKARFPNAKLVDTTGLPDGWDLADPVPSGVSIRGLLDAAGDIPTPPEPEVITQPFKVLGHYEGDFHYLSYLSGRVEVFSASEHTELPLQMISNDAFWLEKGFHQERGNGVDWKAVAKHLFTEQWKVGVYDPENIRGIGCWLEGKNIVYHAGDHLIVNGVRTDIFKHKSEFIYPKRKSIKIETDYAATVDDIAPLLEMCELLPWEVQKGWLLAAICFLSPICGALPWRPSAWLCGPAGTGKSWTYANVITPLIGPCIKALSNTTSAAVRQVIGCDAIPVAFDEIEARDSASAAIIQVILSLVRQASSETGGAIFKGTPSGVAQKFKVRSTFIFSSIAMAAVESADESRIVRLEYKRRLDEEARLNFKRIEELCSMTSNNPKFAQSFLVRAISKAAEIREASIIFADAIKSVTHDARKGQQYGVLAAGYWFLTTDSLPTIEQATAWAECTNWRVLSSTTERDTDHSRAADILLQAKIELVDGSGKTTRNNIGEVLADYYEAIDSNQRRACFEALMRVGVHPMAAFIDVAVRHTELKKIFQHTQFADLWSDYFKRVEGAVSSNFKPKGSKAIWSVRLPKAHLIEPKQDDTE